ncbi:hypothetical protein ACJX0J_006312, partial [Zea mays]
WNNNLDWTLSWGKVKRLHHERRATAIWWYDNVEFEALENEGTIIFSTRMNLEHEEETVGVHRVIWIQHNFVIQTQMKLPNASFPSNTGQSIIGTSIKCLKFRFSNQYVTNLNIKSFSIMQQAHGNYAHIQIHKET